MMKPATTIPRAARAVEVLLGLVFLGSALLKAADVNLFVVQVSYYGVVHGHAYQAASVLATLVTETALALALLLGCRARGLTFAAILALLAVFTGLIGYGWAFHDLRDCGCFGPIEVSPPVSVAKNGVLAVAVLAAWAGFARAGRLRAADGATFAFGQTLVCMVAGLAVAGYGYAHLEKVGNVERPFAELVFEDEMGATYDLGQGEYFVALLNTSCHHCQESVEILNEFLLLPEFPPLVGLCFEDDDLPLEDFRLITNALFPTFSMAERTRLFWSLVGTPPRFALVRDGAQVQYWDEAPPEPDEVLGLRGR